MAAETKTKAEVAQLDSLHTALARILQDQLRVRVAAAGLSKLTSGSEAGKLAGDVRVQQAAVQKGSHGRDRVDRGDSRRRSTRRSNACSTSSPTAR